MSDPHQHAVDDWRLHDGPGDRRASLEQPNECKWFQDENWESNVWAASCGKSRYFMVNDGMPKSDNGMKYCCYCGKSLVEVPIKESKDE